MKDLKEISSDAKASILGFEWQKLRAMSRMLEAALEGDSSCYCSIEDMDDVTYVYNKDGDIRKIAEQVKHQSGNLTANSKAVKNSLRIFFDTWRKLANKSSVKFVFYTTAGIGKEKKLSFKSTDKNYKLPDDRLLDYLVEGDYVKAAKFIVPILKEEFKNKYLQHDEKQEDIDEVLDSFTEVDYIDFLRQTEWYFSEPNYDETKLILKDIIAELCDRGNINRKHVDHIYAVLKEKVTSTLSDADLFNNVVTGSQLNSLFLEYYRLTQMVGIDIKGIRFQYKLDSELRISRLKKMDVLNKSTVDWYGDKWILDFLDRKPWKDKVKEELIKIKSSSTSIDKRIDNINLIYELNIINHILDTCTTYDFDKVFINEALDEIMKKVSEALAGKKDYNLEKDFKNIKREIREVKNCVNQNNGCVLFIQGSTGSGKSHIEKRLYSISALLERVVVIEIRNSNSSSFKDHIKEEICSFFGVGSTYFPELANIIWQSGIKVVLYIDDLHTLHTKGGITDVEIIEVIRNYTRYSWVNWVLGIHTFKKARYLGDSINLFDLFFEDIPGKYCETGLLDLDKVNLINHVGESILSSYGITYDSENIEGSVLQWNPLYSHIFGQDHKNEYCESLEERYTEFSLMLGKWLLNKIASFRGEPLDNDMVSAKIYEEIREIVDILINTKSVKFDKTFDKLLAENEIIEPLKKLCIIQEEIYKKEDSLSELGYEYKTYYVFTLLHYWLYKISHESYKLGQELTDIGSFETKYQIDLAMYRLLIVDEVDNKNFLAAALCISELHLSEALFYSVPLISDPSREIIIELTKERKIQIENSPDALVAYAHFISAVDYHDIRHHKKIDLLTSYYESYNSFGLVKFLNKTIICIMQEINGENYFRSALLRIERNKVDWSIHEMSVLLANKTKILIPDDYKRMGFVSKMLKSEKNAIRIYEEHKKTWNNYYSGISFIKEYVKQILHGILVSQNESINIDKGDFVIFAYLKDKELDWLCHRGFTIKNENHIAEYITDIFQHSTSIMLGDFYRVGSPDYKKSFCNYIDDLLSNLSVKKRKHAAHYVYNSIHREDLAENIDMEIKKFLRKIYYDPELFDFVSRNENFFRKYMN